MMNVDKEDLYLTPSEIIEKYPELHRTWNWTAHKIGVVCSMNLVRSKNSASLKKKLILVKDIIALIKYTNEVFERRKIKLDK